MYMPASMKHRRFPEFDGGPIAAGRGLPGSAGSESVSGALGQVVDTIRGLTLYVPLYEKGDV